MKKNALGSSTTRALHREPFVISYFKKSVAIFSPPNFSQPGSIFLPSLLFISSPLLLLILAIASPRTTCFSLREALLLRPISRFKSPSWPLLLSYESTSSSRHLRSAFFLLLLLFSKSSSSQSTVGESKFGRRQHQDGIFRVGSFYNLPG